MEEPKKAVEIELPKGLKRYILLGRYDKSNHWYCFTDVGESADELLIKTHDYTYIEKKIFELELPYGEEEKS